MNTNSTKLTTAAMAVASALLLGACSDSTGPGGDGRVSAVLTDSPSGSTVSYQDTQAGAPMAASGLQGQMSGSAQAYIYSQADGWIALGSPSNANVTLQSSNETTVHSQASVPEGTYTKVRLILEGGKTNVAAGSVFGGFTLSALVSISMGGSDGKIVIEKTVQPFTVTANATTRVRFDLNSEVWVNQQAAESKTCSDAEVSDATTADVEHSPQ
jgi:hypothetical protein